MPEDKCLLTVSSSPTCFTSGSFGSLPLRSVDGLRIRGIPVRGRVSNSSSVSVVDTTLDFPKKPKRKLICFPPNSVLNKLQNTLHVYHPQRIISCVKCHVMSTATVNTAAESVVPKLWPCWLSCQEAWKYYIFNIHLNWDSEADIQLQSKRINSNVIHLHDRRYYQQYNLKSNVGPTFR